ncbi:hypothetical protein KTQ42_22770 [Noviherbaspirillum sp. L7-7A]|uniref:restriction endonuclease-related protein n=1 Tax=Noviherbaspirillum sp. L7-7A TaxID=2850560 RepID=UPI001C2C5050|nr:hypothetical protein [Noviherbaspirillum sp. L7-7A]MBV0882104.1 hypothetical protein [Noviherbaspirillum sp. L7-7A]
MPPRSPGRKAATRSSAASTPANHTTTAVVDPAERDRAICLLAQGIQLIYRNVSSGRGIVVQDHTVPAAMQTAQSLIGLFRMIEGKQEGPVANLHNIIALCKKPFSHPDWGVQAFHAGRFDYADSVLVDAEFDVPTQECQDIAKVHGGFGNDQIVQHILFERLRTISAEFGLRKHEVYTALRELPSRHKMGNEEEISAYLSEHNLQRLIHTIRDDFYEPVPLTWRIEGKVHQCPHCGALMKPTGKEVPASKCPIVQCATLNPAQAPRIIDPKESRLLVAKPQILKYWAAPAIDEIRIFDEGVGLGIKNVVLYPLSDAADISFGNDEDIGIDVKSYASPEMLARHFLTNGIGGLINYRKRIVAISDHCVDNVKGGYIARLRQRLREDSTHVANALDFMSVSDLVRKLPEMKNA